MSAEMLSICIRKKYPGFDLAVSEKLVLEGVTAIFGPSGGGKTTLLRLIAGFETPDEGRIALGDEVFFDSAARLDTPSHRRPVGTMFPEARLFPHLNVGENLSYAHSRSGEAGNGAAINDVVAAFDLAGHLKRDVRSLSGGERQRAALARTILVRPSLILLDEPLAAIDRARKGEIIPYLDNLPSRFGAPVLYVTHDIDEVARLADRILVLAKGRVEAYGGAADIMAQYDLEPITGAFGASTLLEGVVKRQDAERRLTHIAAGKIDFVLPMNSRLEPDAAVRLRIRAADVAIAKVRPEAISIRNIIPGRIAAIDAGADTSFADIRIDAGSASLTARVTQAAVSDLDLTCGMDIFALVKSVSLESRL